MTLNRSRTSGPAAPAATGRRRLRPEPAAWAACVAFLAVVAFGLVWLPYYGDQAFFAVMGHEVVDGRVPYTGVWDVKQPGVFLWYGLEQAVLGSGPAVTHAVDVLVAVLASLLVGLLVRDRVSPVVARWTPVMAAAAMLLPAGAFELGQVEQLLCLPMTAAMVLLTRRPGPVRTVLAGVCIGVVAVLKLWTAGVLVVAALLWLLAGGVAGRRAAAARFGLLVAGAAVPMGAVVGWLAAAGALGVALETWFLFPQQMLALPGVRTFDRLAGGAARYAVLLAPVLLLAAARLPAVLRRRHPLDLALVGWVAVGLVVVLAQLWWAYHWWQLTPALVALAALGLEDLRERGWLVVPSGRPLVVAVLVAAALPAVVFGGFRPNRPLMLGNGFTVQSRATIAGPGVPAARRELAAVGLRPHDSLLVFGDPTVQLVAGTPTPTRLNGWSPELFTTAQWAEIERELAAAPPDLVLVSAPQVALLQERGPGVTRLLATAYDLIRSTGDGGHWYRHHSSPG